MRGFPNGGEKSGVTSLEAEATLGWIFTFLPAAVVGSRRITSWPGCSVRAFNSARTLP